MKQGIAFGQHTDSKTRFGVGRNWSHTRNQNLTGSRFEQASQHLNRGRFAGAVRAQKPENDTLRDFKSDAVYSSEIAETFHQPASLYFERRFSDHDRELRKSCTINRILIPVSEVRIFMVVQLFKVCGTVMPKY